MRADEGSGLQMPGEASGALDLMKSRMKNALLVGNSDGVGLALTRKLLHEDWMVRGVSRSRSPVDSSKYLHEVLNVRDPDYEAALAQFLPSEKIDLCIYCAGTGEFFDPARIDQDVATFETNLVGLARTAARVVPIMLANPPATLVGLSSIADVMPSAAAPAYAASKAGMSSYLEGLRAALRGTGVSVVNLRLGFVDTKMAKSPNKPFMMTSDRAAERILRSVLVASPPKRISLPRRMAFLMWLLSWTDS
jgi:short-subunit dehydrogenase